MSSGSEDKSERRTALAEGLGLVINSILSTRSLLSPAALAANALGQYQDQSERQQKEDMAKQEAEMRAMVAEIRSLRASFEGGKLILHIDKPTILGLLENALKKSLAAKEAAMTATFKVEPGYAIFRDHDAELVLPGRSIYVKFVPEDRQVAEFAVSYLERARQARPSEYLLLTPTEEQVDFPFEPVFSERGVTRGRLRTCNMTGLLAEMVGDAYEVEAAYEPDGGFLFTISKKQPPAPETSEQSPSQ